MAGKTWLEVALNGPWTRARQPRMPVDADEIVADAIACIDQGAAIVHFHAYDPQTGRQRDRYELYAPIIEAIRRQRDAIIYPTIPFYGSDGAQATIGPEKRFAAVEKLLHAGLIEWAVVDPGSTHLTNLADVAAGKPGFVYLNPEDHIRYGMALAAHGRMRPSFAIYEPGFLRLGAAMQRAYPDAPTPVYRFMFSTAMSFGFPPEEYALQAYLSLLEAEAPGAPWMVAGLGVEIWKLIPAALRQGGHVRVGLEDAPLGSAESNADLVRRAALAITQNGGVLAKAADIRAA